MRNPFTTKAAHWIGYVVFFSFCFVLFTYWTFPYDRVRDLVQNKAAEQGYELHITDLRPNWLTGMKAQGVSVRKVVRDDSDLPPTTIDELKVRISLLSLLIGRQTFSFSADIAGGEIDGQISNAEKTSSADLEFESVELKQIPALRQFTKVPLAGSLSGHIEYHLPEEAESAIANVNIVVEEMTLGDGKAKIPIPNWGGLAIDRADMGKLELITTTDKGIAKISKFESDGKDIKLKVSGEVKLIRPMVASRADLLIRIVVEEAYKKRSAKIAGLFELAQSRPAFKKSQTTDGAIQFKINGAFNGRLSPKPAGGVSAPSGS